MLAITPQITLSFDSKVIFALTKATWYELSEEWKMNQSQTDGEKKVDEKKGIKG